MPHDVRTTYFSKWFAPAADSSDVLSTGSSGLHIKNLTRTLAELGYRAPTSESFGNTLSKVVKKFQHDHGHGNEDGMVGPGTRRLITTAALGELGPDFFDKLAPTYKTFYQVFISYAWADSARIDRLHKWLVDHEIGVKRDVDDFQAGREIPKEIEKYLQLSDKAIIVYTAASQTRDWPAFERYTAENIERHRGTAYLVYLALDGVRPPQHDPNRIFIDGTDKPLDDVGGDLLHAIRKVESGRTNIEDVDVRGQDPL